MTSPKTKAKPKPAAKPAAKKLHKSGGMTPAEWEAAGKPGFNPSPKPVRASALPQVQIRPEEVIGGLRLDQIKPCPFNVRKAFDDADLASLAESIGSIGLKDRLLVRPIGTEGKKPQFDAEKGWKDVAYYELVDGERRYRALGILAETRVVDRVPCVIRFLTDDEVRAIMLASREQSRDLTPSELIAGYAELAKDHPAEWVAAKVGKPVGHVRSILRLAKLPAWAVAAIDAGTLPKATAELVARVPGEESRKKAAGCVLTGMPSPGLLMDDWEKGIAKGHQPEYAYDEPLSFRDTKDLIRQHFTVELKGCPFDRKSLDLLPTAGSCEACPKRAGNDPEATAEGVRGDVCLDPDCFRSKVAAYRQREIEKATDKGLLTVPDDFSWYMNNGKPPSGWLDVKSTVSESDEVRGLCVMPAKDNRWTQPLTQLLNKLLPQQYLAFDREGKPRRLVKTKDVRAVLTDLGVIPKPKADKKEEKPSLLVSKSVPDLAKVASPTPVGPSWVDVCRRVSKIAGVVAFEMGKNNPDGLEGMQEQGDSTTNAAWEALKLLVMWQVENAIEEATEHHLSEGVTTIFDLHGRDDNERGAWPMWKSWVDRVEPSALIGLLLRAAMLQVCTARLGSMERTRDALLEWCELDWDQLEQQARRELTPGEKTADEKIAAAEKEMEANPVEEPTKKGKGAK